MVDLIAVLRAAGYESTARKLADPLTWGRSSRSLTALDRECLLRVLGGRPRPRRAPGVASHQPRRATRHRAPGRRVRVHQRPAPGWVAVSVEDPEGLDPTGVATYCPPFAALLVEDSPRGGVYT